jgi:hypothetical protein
MTNEGLMSKQKRTIDRLAIAFAEEEEALIGAAYQRQMKHTKRAYDSLRSEYLQLRA